MKRKLYHPALFFASVLILLSCALISCNGEKAPQTNKEKFSSYSMDYFDTVTTIVGYEESEAEFKAIADEMIEMLGEYHRLYTIYHRFDGLENLCTINELKDGAHRTVKVDKRIIDLLLYAKEMHALTDGRVNIAMGSVLSLWHSYRSVGMSDPTNASLPPIDKLQEAALHTDIEKLVIDEANATVTLTDPQMKLDVGAIAKGYATECIARIFEERGVTGYVLNVGGNVRSIGTKPDGTKWTVGIEDSQGGEDYLAYLALDGQSVVTSGSYQRFYYVDGKRYHHIIDPDTLMPSEGFLSVSIVCPDSGLGDALSTALFCLSKEKGLALIESIPNAEAMWVTASGERSYSSGFDRYIKK